MPVSRETSQPWNAVRLPEWRIAVVRPADPVIRPEGLDALDDVALVAKASAGSREAFDVLVVRHQRVIYQLCYRFLHDHADAGDAMQDTFLRAWRALPRFKRDSAFATWLYRVAVNVCLSRSTARRPASTPVAADALVADDVRHDTDLLRRERAAHVRRAVDRLPHRQRATVILRVFHELPHAEIATVLGSSVGSVKANFFHALRNLRRILDEESTR
jgi:RNA polymerase sigma-70 factor, ECF subfamily